jgi:hypothetical protein
LYSAAVTKALLHSLEQLIGDQAAMEIYLNTQFLTNKELRELRSVLEIIINYVSDSSEVRFIS